jgi:hypothetical protein
VARSLIFCGVCGRSLVVVLPLCVIVVFVVLRFTDSDYPLYHLQTFLASRLVKTVFGLPIMWKWQSVILICRPSQCSRY